MLRGFRFVAAALAFAAAGLAGPVGAQQVTTSARPDSVSVTVYRAPNRSAGDAMDLESLEGYALITETRRVSIPAGESDIRFEGVAGGIIPQSAIVTGLPEGVIEKNRDALLLSPSSLLDRSLGRRVHLRRTSRATGAVTEQDAVIRSGADGAVVLQTKEGFEALRCTGLPEQIVYPGVPAGLSAKPTLSVRTRSARPATATVTLSYLATGFDWQADYVAHLSPAGDRMDLFAWVTLANGDETSFVDANTQAVAGHLHREQGADDSAAAPDVEELSLNCWPAGTTGGSGRMEGYAAPPPPPPPPPPMMAPAPIQGIVADEIVIVTGARIARQEELGDLKLYRLPDPVTVAAHSQKQVAMIDRKAVPVELFYRAEISDGSAEEVKYMLRALNKRERGLGLPLPAGRIALFQEGAQRPVLIGEGSLEDKAVGEEVEIEAGDAANVTLSADGEAVNGSTHKITLTVANALPYAIWFEADIRPSQDRQLLDVAQRTLRKPGKWVWRIKVPANASRTFHYHERDTGSD